MWTTAVVVRPWGLGYVAATLNGCQANDWMAGTFSNRNGAGLTLAAYSTYSSECRSTWCWLPLPTHRGCLWLKSLTFHRINIRQTRRPCACRFQLRRARNSEMAACKALKTRNSLLRQAAGRCSAFYCSPLMEEGVEAGEEERGPFEMSA